MNGQRRRVHRARREGGFTFVETIVTVAVLGLFVLGLSVALIVSSRKSGTAREPLDASVAEQQVAFWLPTDMLSLGTASPDIDVATARGTSDCNGRLAGVRVLHLGWNDGVKPEPKTFTVNYTVEVVSGASSLVRHACEGDAASSQVLTRNIDLASNTVPNGVAAMRSDRTVTLRVAILGRDGKTSDFRVSADQPVKAIPTTTTPPTSTRTSALASGECAIAGTGATIAPNAVGLTAAGALKSSVAIEIETEGSCGLLTADLSGAAGASPGATALVLAPNIPSADPRFEQWTATVGTSSTSWEVGTFTVKFLNDGKPIPGAPTATLKVTAPCTVEQFGASPYNVAPTPAGQLSIAVVITAGKVDPRCGALSVSIKALAAGGTPPVDNVPLVGSTSRTAVLSAALKGWVAGTYKLTVREGPVAMSPEVAVNLAVGSAGACRIEGITVSPDPVLQAAGAGSTLPLGKPVNVQLTVSPPGACGGLTGTISGPNAGVTTLQFTSASNWSATIPAGAEPWATGTYTIKLAASVPLVGQGSGSFTVSSGCELTGLTVTPPAVAQGAGGGSKALRAPVAIAATSAGSCNAVSALIAGASPPVTSVALTASGPNAWAGQINADPSKKWLAGPYRVSLSVAGITNPSWPTANFAVTAGCAAKLRVSPSAATLASGAGANARALRPLTKLVFTTDPATRCGALSVKITGPSPGVTVLALAGSPVAGTVADNSGQLWRPGRYTATLLEDGSTISASTATFSVGSGCSVSRSVLVPSAPATLVTGSAVARNLKGTVRLSIVKSGSCGPLRAVVSPVGSTPAPPVASLDLPGGSATIGGTSQSWAAGSYSLVVQENGIVVSGFPTSTLTVDPGCTVVAPLAAPPTIERVTGSSGQRPLKAAVTVTVGGKGSCAALTVAVTPSPGPGSPAPGVPSVELNGGIGTIGPSTAWSPGTYVTTLYEAGTAVPGVPSGALIVKEGCTVAAPVVSPQSAVQIAGLSGPRPLRDNIALSVTSSGTCGPLTLALAGSSPGVASVALDGGGKGAVAKRAEAWGTGAFTATLKEGGAAVAGVGTAKFTVDSGCTFTSPPTPSASQVGRLTGPLGARPLKASVNFDVGASGCTGLSIAITGTDPGDASVTLSNTGAGSVLSSSVWNPGIYKATLLEAGAPVAGVPTADLTVGDGCTVINPVVSTPSGVALATGPTGPRPLGQAVGFGVSVSGSCAALGIGIFGPGPGVPAVPLDSSGQASIAPNAEVWGVGTFTATLTEGGLPVAGVAPAALTITSGCTVTFATPAPESVALTAAGKLAASVSVAVAGEGTCGALSVEASGTGAVGVASRAPAAGAVTYAANAEVWGSGVVTLRLAEDGTVIASVPARTFTITAAPCTVSAGPTLTPATIGRKVAEGKLAGNVQISVTATGCRTLTATIAKHTAATIPPGLIPVPLVLTAGVFRGTIDGESIGWSPGTYVVAVLNDGAAVAGATATLTVT